jgi:hypothetical protein
MRRFSIYAGLALFLFAACAAPAQARIFEPQRNWWSSGRTCIESRNPPGLAWETLPPRACVARAEFAVAKPRADAPPSKDDDYALAGETGEGDKFIAKI